MEISKFTTWSHHINRNHWHSSFMSTHTNAHHPSCVLRLESIAALRDRHVKNGRQEGEKQIKYEDLNHSFLSQFFLPFALKIRKEKRREQDKRSVLWNIKALHLQLPTMAPNVKTPMASWCSGQKRLTITRASNSNTVQILQNICYDPVLNTHTVKHPYIKLKIILKLR